MGDILLSNDDIQRLILIRKVITDKPQKEDKRERQHFRNDMKLESIDGIEQFSVHFRRHSVFIENFSIILRYNPPALKGAITLYRCNGTHGPTRIWEHHNSPHTHKATAEDLLEGRDVESEITVISDYSSYEQAAVFFSKKCNIEDCEYINKMRQLKLI